MNTLVLNEKKQKASETKSKETSAQPGGKPRSWCGLATGGRNQQLALAVPKSEREGKA